MSTDRRPAPPAIRRRRRDIRRALAYAKAHCHNSQTGQLAPVYQPGVATLRAELAYLQSAYDFRRRP